MANFNYQYEGNHAADDPYRMRCDAYVIGESISVSASFSFDAYYTDSYPGREAKFFLYSDAAFSKLIYSATDGASVKPGLNNTASIVYSPKISCDIWVKVEGWRSTSGSDKHFITAKTDSPIHVTVNASPTVPVSISIPDTIRGGEDAKVSWPAATDPDGNLDGYIVERSYNGGSSWSQIYQGRETSTTTMIPLGTETVMFRVCAYDTAGAKSGWRTSENRTVINNRAPAAPPSISVPLKPAGGEKLTVTWTASTDADGNLEGYELERQWDGTGAFTQIYKGTGLSYQDSIPKGEHTSVVYRVRAYDSFASYSSYTTSPSRTIDNNTAPVIECSQSGDLGEKSEGFSIQYTIKDAEKQEVTVTEKVGDMVKRTYKATLDEQATFEITDEYFQKILNGAQTVQIVATDSAGKSSTLELTFTKAVHKAVITLEEPLAVEEQITVAVLAITGKIPADATQLIELTNNGNDPEPVWEDATADVKAGRNHPFTNKTQTNGWAFNFRVTVERGESGEDGNIVSIQGGFQ
ncbi:hypothetical protein SAMN02745978_01047 [Butyricicoccus pullicaecorum DSM 23266]|uniref:Fibronectin type-III domain-containing protein n=1 Tax=Butyricicoccus pullicaecorum 1.2 TaxID=1203606 RepID=R8W4K7_9FIRM|nr:hypothetical protein HMPREF1526_00343 [Butyricicoccus pullicaecorum 1.2]SKA56902.1 hypothetical protein SAMN02745978_01047 [Butyricicoccus pullicaecorum DSM 23266]